MTNQKRNFDDHYVVIIHSKEEQDQLKNRCLKHHIPLLYPELFDHFQHHSLWLISKNGVGLIETAIARNTLSDHIIQSISEFH